MSGLIILYAALLAFNVLFNFILWRRTSRDLFRIFFFAWLAGVVTFVCQGLAVSLAPIYRLLFTFFGYCAFLMYARLGTLLVKLPMRWRLFMAVELGGLGLSVLLNALGASTNLMAIPGLVGQTFPLFFVSAHILIRHKDRVSFVVSGYLVSMILFGLHALDYAYVIDKPQFIFAVFTVAIILAFAMTTFGTAAALEDISHESARIETEARIGASLVNSAKMAALGEMAGGVAHEINTPLAIIKVNSEMLEEALAEQPAGEERVPQMLKAISHGVGRIAKIVQGLRSFSSEDEAGGAAAFSSAPVSEIIESTLDLCREKFREKSIVIRANPLPGVKANCRPFQISQILLNLLNNAADAVEASPTENKWISIDVREGENAVQVLVSDGGKGVSPEIKDKIFQPFFTTKPIGKGTGLGLSVSQGIAESNRGTLILDPKNPVTTFILSLPKAVS